MEKNIELLKNYFEGLKEKEELKLDNNDLYENAKENIKYFNKMLDALEQMDIIVACECDYCA